MFSFEVKYAKRAKILLICLLKERGYTFGLLEEIHSTIPVVHSTPCLICQTIHSPKIPVYQISSSMKSVNNLELCDITSNLHIMILQFGYHDVL